MSQNRDNPLLDRRVNPEETREFTCAHVMSIFLSGRSVLRELHSAAKEPILGAVILSVAWASVPAIAAASKSPPAGPKTPPTAPASPAVAQPQIGSLYIQEFRVDGAHLLSKLEIEEAVYPFMGPGRTPDDVDQARAALEKAYRDKGYQAEVTIPEQNARGGVVMLQVTEAKVGRLRVHGSRYFSLSEIKKHAPSMAQGATPNFNQINRDIVALNQWPDRRITPTLAAGSEPGTVDIDLNVKDTFPLHGSVELNNRYSANTTPLRINASLSYNNLWQLGHSIGGSYQVAPERPDDATIYSAYYLARFPNVDWLTLTLEGRKQHSNVTTSDGPDAFFVVAPGETVGLRAGISLPPGKNFFHTLSLAGEYKHYISLGLPGHDYETTYFLWSADYSATLSGKGYLTQFNAGVSFSVRGSSDATDFERARFKADDGFIKFRADLSHTQDLPLGFQLFGRVGGQIADRPLIPSEQIAGGGLDSVRGYLEATVLEDNAIFGSVELRSPSLLFWLDEKSNEWRIYAFCDGGIMTKNEPLPEEQSRFELASIGVGSRIRLFDHLNGSIDAGLPLIDQETVTAYDLLLTFRVSADF